MQQQILYQDNSHCQIFPLHSPLQDHRHRKTFQIPDDFSLDTSYETAENYFSEPMNSSSRGKEFKYQFMDKIFPEIFSSVLIISLLLVMNCVKERFQSVDKNKIIISSNGFSSKVLH